MSVRSVENVGRRRTLSRVRPTVLFAKNCDSIVREGPLTEASSKQITKGNPVVSNYASQPMRVVTCGTVL